MKTDVSNHLGPEPLLIKAGDPRVKLGFTNTPPKVDCRVVAESYYQYLIEKTNNKITIMKTIEKVSIEFSAKPGASITDCIRESIAYSAKHDIEVILLHNGNTMHIFTRELENKIFNSRQK